MNPAFRLKNVSSLNEYSHSMNLERNLVMFFDYGCVAISGFQNIYFNTTFNGASLGQLKPANSAQYPSTTSSVRAWEGFRTNWVWGGTGIDISGVYINGTFTTSGFNINYKNGQVILDSGIASTSTVKCSFSTKSVYWDAADAPWYRELMTETYKYSAFDEAGIGSGIRNIVTERRIPLPAVIVRVSTSNNFYPYQIGGGSWYKPDISFHIFTETPDQRKKLVDIISSQNGHSFLGTDFNKAVANNAFPFNSYGFLVSGAKTFEQLQPLYPWQVRPISFENLNGVDIVSHPSIYTALVKGNACLVLDGV